MPANGHCGFDSPVTGQLEPNFPRAANPAPWCLANLNRSGLTAQLFPPRCAFHQTFSSLKKYVF